VRAPLVRWLADEARRAREDLGRYRLLDVGCGQKPYEELFAPYASTYVGVDPVENARADLRGSVEALPVDDNSFDVVLCNQVLEHCDDPRRAVSELRRVTARGGRVLASTHGVMPYHPSPSDYWRWTHTGLEKLFRENAGWESVTVVPGSGSVACVAMIVAINVHLFCKRLGTAFVARPFNAGLNAVAEALDARTGRLRNPDQPGTLFANFHVVAQVAG
jgi:SAM-dependent methyltransferase